jgi:hypothetical protein
LYLLRRIASLPVSSDISWIYFVWRCQEKSDQHLVTSLPA